MSPHTHVAEKPEATVRCHLVVYLRYLLDLLVIRSDTEPDEAEWSRETIKHVDLCDQVALLEEMLGRIEPSRPRSHYGYTERL